MEAKLTEAIKHAMKSGDKPRLMALRAVKSALTNERTRHGGPLSDDDAVKVVASHRKKMMGAREQYVSANRQDMADQADVEIAVCDELLPAQLSPEDVTRKVDEAIEKAGATKPADMGKVMGPLMKELAGQVDGNEVKRLVMQRLGG